MGVAGVGDLRVPAADLLQIAASSLLVSRFPRLIVAPVWRAAGQSLRPCQALMRLGVRRLAASYLISRHLQAAEQTIFEDNHLVNGCQCVLHRSLA
jgi:hypothetical protein